VTELNQPRIAIVSLVADIFPISASRDDI